jgi:hypothetical protein
MSKSSHIYKAVRSASWSKEVKNNRECRREQFIAECSATAFLLLDEPH